jgi:hypothetical protein
MAVKVVHSSKALDALPRLIGQGGVLVETDVISAVKERVAGYSKAEDARADLNQIGEGSGNIAYAQGAILKSIRDEGWYQAYGFPFFERFLDAQGIARSTAYAHIELYERITESGVCWSDVQSIGWTKLRYLARQLDEGNREAWIELASKKTVVELRQVLKEQKPIKAVSASEGGVSTQVDTEQVDLFPMKQAPKQKHTLSISLHEDQWETVETAFQNAKDQSDSPYDNVALEVICLNFLAEYHQAFGDSHFFKVAVKQAGYEKTIQLAREFWPDLEIAVNKTTPAG